MILRTIITDDDPRISAHVERLLLDEYDDIQILAKPVSVQTALQAIHMHQPNLLCLDVELGGETSFEILDQIDHKDGFPAVIFITGYDSYSIEALRNRAVDYILKPVNRKDLYKSIDAARARLVEYYHHWSLRFSEASSKYAESRIQISLSDSVQFLKLVDIILFKAESNYTEIHLKDGSKLLSSKTLKRFVSTVPESMFFRSHRSFLINLYEIQSLQSGDGGYLIMTNNAKANITKSRRAELFNRMNNDFLSQM